MIYSRNVCGRENLEAIFSTKSILSNQMGLLVLVNFGDGSDTKDSSYQKKKSANSYQHSWTKTKIIKSIQRNSSTIY